MRLNFFHALNFPTELMNNDVKRFCTRKHKDEHSLRGFNLLFWIILVESIGLCCQAKAFDVLYLWSIVREKMFE